MPKCKLKLYTFACSLLKYKWFNGIFLKSEISIICQYLRRSSMTHWIWNKQKHTEITLIAINVWSHKQALNKKTGTSSGLSYDLLTQPKDQNSNERLKQGSKFSYLKTANIMFSPFLQDLTARYHSTDGVKGIYKHSLWQHCHCITHAVLLST